MFQILWKALMLLLDICTTFNANDLTAIYLHCAFQMSCDILFSIILLIMFQVYYEKIVIFNYKTTDSFNYCCTNENSK